MTIKKGTFGIIAAIIVLIAFFNNQGIHPTQVLGNIQSIKTSPNEEIATIKVIISKSTTLDSKKNITRIFYDRSVKMNVLYADIEGLQPEDSIILLCNQIFFKEVIEKSCHIWPYSN